MWDDDNSSIANVGSSRPNSIVKDIVYDDIAISLEGEMIKRSSAIGPRGPDHSAATINYEIAIRLHPEQAAGALSVGPRGPDWSAVIVENEITVLLHDE
ncbi:hypothetical protein IEQ34_004819 [Dendrobium chrysotoxum]|uniref:Uncharacterized protein n=1 Tax=Dendrobium chrysotoxum TaxID=161865 RepID=A0AAV7H6F6_DENCH|nr:hypothetical protein IEQ34_004819 [Dendrobium chrysotoxum]